MQLSIDRPMGNSRMVYLKFCQFAYFYCSEGFECARMVDSRERMDLLAYPNSILCESETSCFRKTGIRREIEWDRVSDPVSHRQEMALLKSGVLVRRGEYCSIYGDRLDEVEAACKRSGMTLAQGLLIRNQLMVSKVVSNSWKLKDERKVKAIIRSIERQETQLLDIAHDLDLPPVSVFRAVVSFRVFEKYPDFLLRDKKRIVKSIISETSPDNLREFISEWELKELQKAKEYDVVGYSEQTEAPVLWEKALYEFLDNKEINYASEKELRDAEMKITPDCIILDDCYINGQLVRWMDVKSFYGSGLRENRHFSNSLKRQVTKYETEFKGSGAVVFKHGFSNKLSGSSPSTLFLDAGPLSGNEKVSFEVEEF
eukprot:scaffold3389_cov119-Cylindrotheca_fusiformis.AAC.4